MFFRSILLFICLISLSLSAKGRRNEYWELYGTSLYWNPCGGSFVVGVDEREVQLVGTDYDWGFRAGCAYVVADGSSVLAGEYTLFDVTYAAEFGDVVARRRFRYETIDGRLGIALCREGCDKFYAFAVGRYLDFREKRTGGERAQESLLSGGGVLVGAGGFHPLGKAVYLTAEAGGFLGLGEQVTRRAGLQIPSETTCLPALEARVGLRTIVPSQDHCLMLEAGYEIIYYWGALRWLRPDGGLERDNLGMQGAYGAVRLRF
jgi:Legionella pneumophila major outer membrane protein precursor